MLTVDDCSLAVACDWDDISYQQWRSLWLFAGVSGSLMQRLQSVLNAAARLVFFSRSEHTNSFLLELHWLKVPERIQYRLCVLAFRCLHCLAPSYYSHWMLVVNSVRVRQHSSYHPPVDPLSATERSPWLLHVPGIHCHPVFGLCRRWDPSVCI